MVPDPWCKEEQNHKLVIKAQTPLSSIWIQTAPGGWENTRGNISETENYYNNIKADTIFKQYSLIED